MCFFCFSLHLFASLADGTCVLSPLPNFLMPPFIHFPSAATDTPNMAALMGGERWVLGRLPSGNFQGLQFSISASTPDLLFGTGAEEGSHRGQWDGHLLHRGQMLESAFLTKLQSKCSQIWWHMRSLKKKINAGVPSRTIKSESLAEGPGKVHSDGWEPGCEGGTVRGTWLTTHQWGPQGYLPLRWRPRWRKERK